MDESRGKPRREAGTGRPRGGRETASGNAPGAARTPGVTAFAGKRLQVALVLAVVLSAAAAAGTALLLRDPEIPLLLPEEGAVWIRPRPAFYFLRKPVQDHGMVFRKRFRVDVPPPSSVLTVRAMRDVSVWLDGTLVLPGVMGYSDWKRPRRVDLGSALGPGEHELRFVVMNRTGPVLLLAHSRSLGLFTGPGWETTFIPQNWSMPLEWRPVATADDEPGIALSREFPRVDAAFLSTLPWLVPVFLAAFLATLAFHRGRAGHPWMERAAPTASRVRWALIAAWVVLGINNIGKIPYYIGFDVEGHLQYVEWVASNHRIPLATDGWEMYHPPLYYVLSALLYAAVKGAAGVETAQWAIRAIPLSCGLLQVEVARRTLRHVFPGRDDLQALGTLVAGALPMSLYMSQTVSNEPMAALATGAVLLGACALVGLGGKPPARWRVPVLGAALGLALLTKFTAVLLVPIVALAVFHGLRSGGRTPLGAALGAAAAIGIAAAVSGWYYARNLVVLGKVFASNWDPEIGIAWWQDPGFRTLRDYLAFGDSLSYPVLSGVQRFWDAVHSTFWLDGLLSGQTDIRFIPPWNTGPMLSGAWLGFVPALAMAAGAVATLAAPAPEKRPAQLLSLAAIGIHVLALAYFTLKVPFYSTGKAFYTLGLLPCYGAVAAAGFDPLLGRPAARAVLFGLVACWAVASFAAYFVL